MIEAAQNSKQRIRLNEKTRMYNKARKSAIATRMKKVAPRHRFVLCNAVHEAAAARCRASGVLCCHVLLTYTGTRYWDLENGNLPPSVTSPRPPGACSIS